MLDEKHAAELRASGIDETMVAAAGIRSVADSEVGDLLGWQPRDFNWGRGWAIPFFANGEAVST